MSKTKQTNKEKNPPPRWLQNIIEKNKLKVNKELLEGIYQYLGKRYSEDFQIRCQNKHKLLGCENLSTK